MTKANDLIGIYKTMSKETFESEVDAMFEIVHAILEVSDSLSIEYYPKPDLKIQISMTEAIGKDGKYLC